MGQLHFDLTLPYIGQQLCDHSYRERLTALLSQDLDFHTETSRYATHSFHAFPAKFPPQLPRRFIDVLTQPGDVVMDPMMGSGTTIVEAFLSGRVALGFDIDPLALLLCKVKVTPLDLEQAMQAGAAVLEGAILAVQKQSFDLAEALGSRFDKKTRDFIEYWFHPQTQYELLGLVTEIERVEDESIRAFLQLAFSAIIITKSGGVSLARDLAHTRPHRVPHKNPRPALPEFRKRMQQNLNSLAEVLWSQGRADVRYGNAQDLPLESASVDLIVTSPPYAANAIDYMRAHKFSLAWFGHPIDTLSQKRKSYIGGESVQDMVFESLPEDVEKVVAAVGALDAKRAGALRRYYSEMTRCFREMYRVLKPGRAAIVVVGTSMMRGVDTRTQQCLAEIGSALGFDVAGIAIRRLDRNRRMMPARAGQMRASQIEHRMHEEYVIGLYKPEEVSRLPDHNEGQDQAPVTPQRD